MGPTGRGLVDPSPDQPGDDVGGLELALGETDGDAADLLNGPKTQRRRKLAGRLRFVFWGSHDV